MSFLLLPVLLPAGAAGVAVARALALALNDRNCDDDEKGGLQNVKHLIEFLT